MCGLVGFVSPKPQNGARQIIQMMCSAIVSRGPDDSGFWQDETVGLYLGHRRLAILELSAAGHQPMQSVSGRFVIVFNGEIYNHVELRKELAHFNWKGGSDTETLLAAFETWGIHESIRRSVGMFSMAIYDNSLSSLTLVRDRLGEKPLYYGWQGQGGDATFMFGSELKALRQHPSFEGRIDRDALAMFMRHNCVPTPYSIYAGVKKLEPGFMLTVSLADFSTGEEQYWSAADVAKCGVAIPFVGSKQEAISHLERTICDAVRSQMLSDVPLGAFLSGGVDSSTVVALMQSVSSQRVKTFTIGFDEDHYNEAIFAKEVAQFLGTDHAELYVSSSDALSVIPMLSSIYDEPFADSSQIPTYLVSKLAKQSVTVALSGDGGDELFCGYNRYQLTAAAWGKLSMAPVALRKMAAAVLTSISPRTWNYIAAQTPFASKWADVGYKLHKGAGVMAAASVEDLYMGLVSQWDDPAYIVVGASEPRSRLVIIKSLLEKLSNVEVMMLLDLLTYLPDDILTKVDRAAMSVSLETRVPFLDHRVVECAWRMPLCYKLKQEISGYTTKWLLRQVLYKYVPATLIERSKMGFGVPIGDWLRGPLKEWAESLLNVTRLKGEGYFHPEPILRKWEEHVSGKRDWQHQLWCVLMFQSWLENESKDMVRFL